MEQEIRIVLKPTKAGNGFKARMPNGDWVYASKKQFYDMINGRASACSFVPIASRRENDGAEW